ncbi:reverse transcriptase family protein [Microbulbifer sp.]|uniref:reverse transcriptase family protein n=1 Tax=Microbulbifer sp. TaxID=1908541 RepID=UPI002584AAB5|nr:reverse transcriptase family protein [Microbulbifer sp.]
MVNNNTPHLKISPIANLSSLASILSLNLSDLIHLADNAENYWRRGKLLKKKSGEPRPTHDAKDPLKTIHQRINNRILKQVQYPYFVMGGISDKLQPRTCKAHASLHSGKSVLISEDIKDFYPSSKCEVVHEIWQYCFNFSHDVSKVLTALTTYQGSIPQGWKTSSYLANLVFWDKEPDLVTLFESRGYVYSRYMDDITVSSKRKISDQDKFFVISEIYKMLSSKGFSPKRSKHEISYKNIPMKVTNLGVNGSRPTISRRDRKNIRAMVYELEGCVGVGGNSEEFLKQWRVVSGKVSHLISIHPKEGEILRRRLRVLIKRK